MPADTECLNLGSCCDAARAADGLNGIEFGDHRFDSDQRTVRAAAFRLLLETGEPAATSSIAATGGLDPAIVTEVLERFARTGNVSLRGDRVVGIAGLSVEPTRHRIELTVGRRWTWCALDAIGIVGAIGDGVIHSELSDCQEKLKVRDGEIESNDLAVLIPDGFEMTTAVDQWCLLANFFPTVASASAWAESNGVKGQAISVNAIASQLIEGWAPVLNEDQQR